MSSWEAKIRKNKTKAKTQNPHLTIDFGACPELQSWITRQADKHGSSRNKIVLAILQDAYDNSAAPVRSASVLTGDVSSSDNAVYSRGDRVGNF